MKQNNIIRTASSRRKEQHSSVQFLNLTNPHDATSSEALAVIRSHVAKNTHGRKQQSRRARLEIRQYFPIQSSQVSDRLPQGTLQTQTEEPSHASVARQQQNREDAQIIERRIWIPNPLTSVTSTRKNPFQTSVTIISDSENALVDHYITFVIDHGYTDCMHSETEQALLQRVRSQFVPWSLTERGLLAGLFMAACRSLLTLHPENDAYRVSLLKYKSECFEILRASLSTPEKCISDHTIALALVLATEEANAGQFLCGNVEYRLHGEAVIKMVRMRGGIKEFGTDGILGHLLARSVYNPAFQYVQGPDAGEVAV
ncbi:hypothetical protein BBK36DRAFT_1128494 [Trichoderma citrinoviride]|uniref:Uncharacterized protein n=1 Tax=Trichoderma citrinoviride TaxID=58853 RepID=A0A2T4B072_9HYPO|nr:hypothetical protein BBK36DRAFT_1128494 [Trichoderma citrinoviride]PTB62723.1 hypothetical protein BBK36DRAFT_1128494 [Trichoderma citrinoviride]